MPERNPMTPLEQKLEQLKLPTMSQHLEPTLKEAATKNLSFAATLESLADLELEARNRRAGERRSHLSRLHARRLRASSSRSARLSRVAAKLRFLVAASFRVGSKCWLMVGSFSCSSFCSKGVM